MVELSDRYQYNKTFSLSGEIDYNITCDHPEFSLLSTTDTFGVIPDSVPEFSTITMLIALTIVIGGFFVIRRRD
jgi:hypothetical protein